MSTSPRIPSRTVVTGASGLIGRSLIASLSSAGREILALIRQSPAPAGGSTPAAQLLWDPYSDRPLQDPSLLEGIDAVVHLSGDNLSQGRWTPEKKQRILTSRTIPTTHLSRLLSQLHRPPRVLVSASAIGIYGDRGDDLLTERSAPGIGFLPTTTEAWESSTIAASSAGIRVVHLRLGVVLSPHGGALAKILPPFRLGLGGRLGSGRAWMSWISLPDVVSAIQYAIESDQLSGAVNAVAPNPVTNSEFTQTLAHTLHRPAIFPVPAAALRLAFGEMAEATILASTRVLPERLTAAGFQFQHPTLDSALRAVLAV